MENKKVVCTICNKQFSIKGIGTHIWRTHGDGINHDTNIGYAKGTRVAWNKGKSIETNPELKEQLQAGSQGRNRKIKSGELKNIGFCAIGYWTDERKMVKSEEKKLLYINFPEKHPNRILANNKNFRTYPEKIAENWFIENKILYEYNKKIKSFYPDFIIGNIIIEIDGERWHDSVKDAKRDLILSNEGYIIYRIKAKDRIEDRLKDIFNK